VREECHKLTTQENNCSVREECQVIHEEHPAEERLGDYAEDKYKWRQIQRSASSENEQGAPASDSVLQITESFADRAGKNS
jgi:hypothetical protein